ncbi:hydroxyisourate hydrolase [Streptomyces globisporus]|uniref:Hydroxyisourate hydrolase n=1 Tax=Streptomyces globisporus TaxID=1908 RepID=A0A927BPF0_STRGL|nr:hydroxyisourate hydrolase [Streptomyces globisporus]
MGVHPHPGHQHRPPRRVRRRLARRPRRERRAVRHARASATDADGRCKDLPALPEGTTHVRLAFDTETYFSKKQAEAQQDAPRVRDSGAFFPEVTIAFAVVPGEHYHVPLLLNPFGYSVYRGS